VDGVLRAVVVTGQAIRATAIMLPAWWQSDELMRGMRRYSFLLTTVSLVALTEKSQSRFLIFAIGFFVLSVFSSYGFITTLTVCFERMSLRASRCTSLGVTCCRVSPLVSMSSDW